MNTSIRFYLNFSLAVLLTVAALAYTFWSMTEWPEKYELVPSAATVFVEKTEIPKEVPWSGTQVVAKLYQLSEEDELTITVDGFSFDSIEDVEENQWRVHLDGQYLQDIVMTDGEITSIVFSLKGV